MYLMYYCMYYIYLYINLLVSLRNSVNDTDSTGNQFSQAIDQPGNQSVSEDGTNEGMISPPHPLFFSLCLPVSVSRVKTKGEMKKP